MSGHSATGDRRSLVRAFAASLSGTSLEWYDFAVYGAAAALVFGDLFFPSGAPLTGTLLAFGTYAAGYVARPLGGIVFGRLGDRVGRKKVLIWTLTLIGVSTVLIGFLPTHGQVGILAPILLVVLRFAQGVGVGGEWGGAVLLTSEFSEPESRGFWASAAQVGPPLGNVLANAVLGPPGPAPQRCGLRVVGLARRVHPLRRAGRVRPVDPDAAGGDPCVPADRRARRGACRAGQGSAARAPARPRQRHPLPRRT